MVDRIVTLAESSFQEEITGEEAADLPKLKSLSAKVHKSITLTLAWPTWAKLVEILYSSCIKVNTVMERTLCELLFKASNSFLRFTTIADLAQQYADFGADTYMMCLKQRDRTWCKD